MSIAETFLEYAEAFEKTYEDDDWSRLEPFFTPHAVYLPGDGNEIRGRSQALDYLRNSLETSDRRFDSRDLDQFPQPVVTGNEATVPWKVTYKKSGVPDLVICGSETATFEGNAISKLEDVLDEGYKGIIQDWMRDHGVKLTGKA